MVSMVAGAERGRWGVVEVVVVFGWRGEGKEERGHWEREPALMSQSSREERQVEPGGPAMLR